MRRTVLLLASLGIVLAACSSSSKPKVATASRPEPTTSATTTQPPPTTPTTVAGAPVTLPGNIASTVQESAFVVAVDPSARTMTIDPMEFLVGAAATTEFRKANPGAGIDTPPNDYYIVNPTKDRVVLPLDPVFDAELVHTGNTTHTPAAPVSLAVFARQPDFQYRPFWVTVERGVATRAVEQYIP
jgi:hypothetical protein